MFGGICVQSDLSLFKPAYKNKEFIVAVLFVISLVLVHMVNLGYKTDILYTHFFYLPIVLGALWFTKVWLTIGMASTLGFLHIYSNFLISGYVVPATVYRAAFLLIVGTVICIVAYYNKRKMEQNIEQMKASVDSDIQRRMLGDMVAAFGHEVRNPMTTVKGYLQLLQKDSSFEPYEDVFSLIIEEIDRATLTLQQCLSLSKNKHREFRPCTLIQVVTGVEQDLRRQAYEHKVEIEFAVEEGPAIEMDKQEISFMLTHLVRNAFESIQPGGKVKVSTIRFPQRMCLMVEDNGPGIDPEMMNYLGMPFMTTKAGHTGLGLAICYGIATHHNAFINFSSNTEGTVARVYFPVNPAVACNCS
jgi:signal transduction histidine kinase